jgi:hypothetical protein
MRLRLLRLLADAGVSAHARFAPTPDIPSKPALTTMDWPRVLRRVSLSMAKRTHRITELTASLYYCASAVGFSSARHPMI